MRTATVLAPRDADAVRALAAAAEVCDGVAPLNDDAVLALAAPDGEHHVLLDAPGSAPASPVLAGYAIRDRHGHGQLVVHPDHRGRGWARALAAALGPVDQWWSFGDLPPARHLALAAGCIPTRTLLLMERDLRRHPATAPTPRPGTALRALALTGADVEALLAVNAAAFADHPEQGELDLAAFEARAAADWFHPEDVLLATDPAGHVVGFHWTKRRGDGLGEVYVLGVHPGAAGQGLGRTLLDAGLAHLADIGCDRVVLYVDGDDERPVRLYESANFVVRRRDVAWAPRPQGAA